MPYENSNAVTTHNHQPVAVYRQNAAGISRPAVSPFREQAIGTPSPATGLQPSQLKVMPAPKALLPGVIQRYGIDDFDTYSEAKKATIYSRAMLDRQTGPIENYFKQKFNAQQQDAIYDTNIEHYGQDEIISDEDGRTELVKQDTELVPHIDHRFPKSQGGSNSYVNAAVLAAKANMIKGARLTVTQEPDVPLAPYATLHNSAAFRGKVGRGRGFTTEQRNAILAANKNYYGKGTPVSDADQKTKLAKFDTSHIPHIDHITPMSEGGTNFYFNAAVVPASSNIEKGGAKGRAPDIDHEIGKLSLKAYYRKKATGELDDRAFVEDDNAMSSSSDGEMEMSSDSED